MRICLITPFYYPKIGGAEIFSQYLAEYLVRNNHQVDIINLNVNNPKNKVEKINRVSIHRLKLGGIKYISFLAGLIRLYFYLKKLNKLRNYDLFHSIGDGLSPLAAGLIKRIGKKKHINTIQGLVIFEEEGRGVLIKIILKIIYRINFNNIDQVHAVSRAIGESVTQFGAKKVVLIPNGVDPTIFRPSNKIFLRRKYGFAKKDKIIVAAARLIKRKGIDYLISAIAGLEEKVTGLKLIVIGEGPERESLEQQINQLKIPKIAKIIDFVSHQIIADYFNLADIVVIPSLHEPFGIVAVEAMACGVPVIGSRVDGLLDIIEDGKNGFLVPAGDIKKLQEKISYLLSNRKIRNKISQAAIATIKGKFLWNNIFAQIIRSYRLSI